MLPDTGHNDGSERLSKTYNRRARVRCSVEQGSGDMKRNVITGAALATVALWAFFGGLEFEKTAVAQNPNSGANPVLPVFEVDSRFPTMPDHMLLGGVGGATAD